MLAAVLGIGLALFGYIGVLIHGDAKRSQDKQMASLGLCQNVKEGKVLWRPCSESLSGQVVQVQLMLPKPGKPQEYDPIVLSPVTVNTPDIRASTEPVVTAVSTAPATAQMDEKDLSRFLNIVTPRDADGMGEFR